MINPNHHPLAGIIAQLKHQTQPSHLVMGVILSRDGQLTIIRDDKPAIVWFKSSAEVYAKYIECKAKDLKKYNKSQLFSISQFNYENNRLLITLYEQSKVVVTLGMMNVFRALSLDFHNNTNIGMFMPLLTKFDQLYEEVKNEPARLLPALKMANDLARYESKTCVSCGTLCHVPELSDDLDISKAELKKLTSLMEGPKVFCFECGKTVLTLTALFKASFDAAKYAIVKPMAAEITKLDMSDKNFDFHKVQSLLAAMMSQVSKTTMTVVDGDGVKNQKIDKPITPGNLPGQTAPPWMN